MKREHEAWVRAEAERQAEREQSEYESQMDRRLNPKSKADFALLYSGLEVWRKEQLAALSGLTGDERTEALVALLKQQCSYVVCVCLEASMVLTCAVLLYSHRHTLCVVCLVSLECAALC